MRGCRARPGRARAGTPRPDDPALDQPDGNARPAAAAPRNSRTSLALPRADLRLVDPVAAGVTNSALVSFPGSMRFLRLLVSVPISFLLTAAASHRPTRRTP